MPSPKQHRNLLQNVGLPLVPAQQEHQLPASSNTWWQGWLAGLMVIATYRLSYGGASYVRSWHWASVLGRQANRDLGVDDNLPRGTMALKECRKKMRQNPSRWQPGIPRLKLWATTLERTASFAFEPGRHSARRRAEPEVRLALPRHHAQMFVEFPKQTVKQNSAQQHCMTKLKQHYAGRDMETDNLHFGAKAPLRQQEKTGLNPTRRLQAIASWMLQCRVKPAHLLTLMHRCGDWQQRKQI